MLQKTKRTWYDTILFKPKLRTYRKFKTMYGDDYVMKYMSRRQRAMFSQFRAGILPLHIETGRWRGTPLEERLCNVCNQNVIEDEMHFLCICPMYANRRHTMYNSANASNPGFERMAIDQKFFYLMQFEWKSVSQ